MSVIPASVKCDGCGHNRQEDSNHWRSFTLFVPSGRCGESSIARLTIIDHLDDGYETHSCGETCTLKLVSRWLATGKLDE